MADITSPYSAWFGGGLSFGFVDAGGKGGGSTPDPTDQALLLSIRTALDKALSNSDCSKLFGTSGLLSRGSSAAQVLDSLINAATGSGPAGNYGSIRFSDTLGIDAQTTVSFLGGVQRFLGFSTSSTVTISTIYNTGNGQPGFGFFNTSVYNAEVTVLHELGHVMT
jgi:hypothetical protein